MPPISVLIPTRNCAAFVPGHIESLRSWIDLAEEIVVVDSHSADGTVELLRAGLSHPRIRFLDHPPGLYQSWNFGIQNAAAKYTYISTVGDSITRDGVEKLFNAAEQFQSDVVISKPRFIDEDGTPLADDRWPIDVIIDRLGIRHPRVLSTIEQFVLAVTNTWGAILGSSASNLYRTDCLKARPFPIDFGTAGDGGWGIINVFDVTIAVTPERFSTFRRHEKTYSLAEYPMDDLSTRLFRLTQTVIAQQRAANPALAAMLDKVRWPELERELESRLNGQARLEALRRASFPWYLNPAAWRVRCARNHAENQIDSMVAAIVSRS